VIDCNNALCKPEIKGTYLFDAYICVIKTLERDCWNLFTSTIQIIKSIILVNIIYRHSNNVTFKFSINIMFLLTEVGLSFYLPVLLLQETLPNPWKWVLVSYSPSHLS